jgi:hypothetical protein
MQRVDFAKRSRVFSTLEREIQTPPRNNQSNAGLYNTNTRRITMRFLSIYKTVERNAPPSQEEMAKMGKLVEEGMKAGWLLGTEGCLPSALGAPVRRSGEKLTVTDGPFTEAKEVVGGFAILEAKSKEEAIELARNFLQAAGDRECELRQLSGAGQNTCADVAARA